MKREIEGASARSIIYKNQFKISGLTLSNTHLFRVDGCDFLNKTSGCLNDFFIGHEGNQPNAHFVSLEEEGLSKASSKEKGNTKKVKEKEKNGRMYGMAKML